MKKVAIIGTGPMAGEYTKVCKKLNCEIIAIGRNETKCAKFSDDFNVESLCVHVNQLSTKLNPANTLLINAVSFPSLFEVNTQLLRQEFTTILSEKPGAINSKDLIALADKCNVVQANLFIAYNRRFFPAITYLKKKLDIEPATSCSFEFTEWSHVIEKLKKDDISLANWFYGNSTHVLDLFCFLAGRPTQLHTIRSGKLSWHKSGSIFAGSGITDKNIVFNYNANWESSGRWGIEICTAKGKYILKPLEKLFFIERGTLDQKEIPIENTHPDLKPGLFEQTDAFVNGKQDLLLTLQEHLMNCEALYDKVIGI